jgi:mono/diheme cytochrome c family protein
MSLRRKHLIRLLLIVLPLLLAALILFVWRTQAAALPPVRGVTQRATIADTQLALTVGELDGGQRIIEAQLHDAGGRPLALDAVQLRFAMPFICADRIDITLLPVAAGRYRAAGTFFWMSGSYLGELSVPADGTSQAQTFVVPIAAPDVRSPFPLGALPDSATLAAGRQLYATHCASCHGDSGRGDGPASVGLSPRPSDLTEHMAAGKHSDEQIYLTIHNGRPGTAMAAWNPTLNTDEIWQLTAYLRTLATP